MGEEGAVTPCEMAPKSDQLSKTYCDPGGPACGEEVAMVCELPTIQLKVCGAVEGTPSTVIERPEGLVVTVTAFRISMFALTC